MPVRIWPGALALALALPLSARAEVLWRGDYESGDLSQWTKWQAASSSRLTVVSSPIVEGRWALRTELRNGDDASAGNRAEVVRGVGEAEGAERYYSWFTYFPATYPINDAWQVFTQWHHSGCCGSPPLEFDVHGGALKLTTQGSTTIWTTPFVRGVWHRFVFHVKFSSDPAVGFVELWMNGAKVIAKKRFATSYAGQVNFLKQGLYRNPTILQTAVVFHDGMTMGTHLADVAPDLVPVGAPQGTDDAALRAQDDAASAQPASAGPGPGIDPDAAQGGAGGDPPPAPAPAPAPDAAADDPVQASQTPPPARGIAGALANGSGCSTRGPATASIAGTIALLLLRRRRR